MTSRNDSTVDAGPASAPTSPGAVLTRGLWTQNPVLVQTLGLCSALAVTNAVANSLAMGLATTFVLVGSSIIVSTMRKLIAHQIRITTYILIIATFLAIADMLLEAIVPGVHWTDSPIPPTSTTAPSGDTAATRPFTLAITVPLLSSGAVSG